MRDETKVFNTRLNTETIQQIRAYAWYRQTTIQAVTQKALDEFFEARAKEVETATEAFNSRGKPL